MLITPSPDPVDVTTWTLWSTRPTTQSSKDCGWCGGQPHPQERCPAREKLCRNCSKKGHSANVCQFGDRKCNVQQAHVRNVKHSIEVSKGRVDAVMCPISQSRNIHSLMLTNISPFQTGTHHFLLSYLLQPKVQLASFRGCQWRKITTLSMIFTHFHNRRGKFYLNRLIICCFIQNQITI